jgi:DNA-binding MarR family transcriptional regulator/GNAT superfamily N-acetyltransferase
MRSINRRLCSELRRIAEERRFEIFGATWVIDPDGVTLHLFGDACTALRSSLGSEVDAAFACSAVHPRSRAGRSSARRDRVRSASQNTMERPGARARGPHGGKQSASWGEDEPAAMAVGGCTVQAGWVAAVAMLAFGKHLRQPDAMSARSVATTATPLVRSFSRELARAGGLLSPDYLESGLSLGEARCLYELGHVDPADSLEISALAERLDLDLGYISRVISRLAARGLVSKRVERRDARARSLEITARGRTRLAALDRHTNRRLGAWLAGKPAPAVDELMNGLRGFLGSADQRVVLRGPRPGMLGHIIARHGEIYQTEFGYPANFEGYVAIAFGELMQAFSPPRDRIFIAERGGRFLGSIAVKGRPHATAQLRFLIVERWARGLGLGRRLVRRVLDHARANGERKIVLDTASNLDAARALYAEHGFRKVDSVAGEPWLPRGVHSERWELDLVEP